MRSIAARSRPPGRLLTMPSLTASILPKYAMRIGVAEFVLAFVSPLLGIGLYALVMVFAGIQYALRPGDPAHRILPAIALIPLLRIQSLVMPIEELPRLTWYVLAGLPVFIAVTLIARALGLEAHDLGLRKPTSAAAEGVAIAVGLGIGLIAYLIVPTPLIAPEPRFADIFVALASLLIFVALLEEVLFRGMLQRLSTETSGWLGPVVVTVVYATLFISSYSVPIVMLMAAAGAVFSWSVHRGASLLGPTIGHALILFAGMVAPALLP